MLSEQAQARFLNKNRIGSCLAIPVMTSMLEAEGILERLGNCHQAPLLALQQPLPQPSLTWFASTPRSCSLNGVTPHVRRCPQAEPMQTMAFQDLVVWPGEELRLGPHIAQAACTMVPHCISTPQGSSRLGGLFCWGIPQRLGLHFAGGIGPGPQGRAYD